MPTIRELIEILPQQGTVKWIGVRPARKEPVEIHDMVRVDTKEGLIGDHHSSRNGSRHVTLIQEEHLVAVASLLGMDTLRPELVRRNIVVSGINLLALKEKRFRVGDAELEFTGLCHPCSQMEVILGPGGYNAMRGHGGITARVIQAASIHVGDTVKSSGQSS